jgi:toxin FitB
MAWLLDTNIISETRRFKPEAKVLAFIIDHPLEELYISIVTVAELRFGIELLTQGDARRVELNEWLSSEIRPMFEHRVLPITEDVMLRWRLLVHQGRKAGYTYSQPDLLIAATALQHGLTVVTRDQSEFERAGVPVVNPWQS